MPKQTKKEKADRRLAKVFSSLVNRRDFVTAAAALGLTITKPADLAAATVTRDEAILMSYFAFWGGAEGNVEADGSLTPTEIATKYPPYNRNVKTPNDGHDGPNAPRTVPHKPKPADNKGPKKAREWLLWRVTYRYGEEYGNWDVWAPYALSNCARMGVLARRNAMRASSTMVTWEHAFLAFYAVRQEPVVPPQRTAKPDKVSKIEDQLCD
jgi:hypothetical protein